MKRWLARALVAVGLMGAGWVHAGTQALGVEIGVSTADQVRTALSKQGRVTDNGINKYSGGPMFKTDGSAYDIEGLNEVLYIFDGQKKLAGLVMNMDKARFDAVFKALQAKYKVASQQRPFVGNQYARFKAPDALIEMDAPHLGFVLEVRYIRNDLMQSYSAQSTAEAEAKKKREAAQF